MIECLCYRQYKVKHKNMLGVNPPFLFDFISKATESTERKGIELRWRVSGGLLSGAVRDGDFLNTRPGSRSTKADSVDIGEKISNGVMYDFMSLEPQ